jgi:hypothetical protein
MSIDTLKWTGCLTVEKFDAKQTLEAIERTGLTAPSSDDFVRLGIAPREVVESGPNLLTTAGLTRICSLILGAGGQAATATSARIGVGDGSTAATVGDVDLSAASGSTHRWFQVMDSSYPSASGAVMTFKSTFATGDGNFAWNEWTIDIGTPTVSSGNTVSATMLNRKVAANGTKASGSSWVATATVTLS